jgi:hypothetical protein
MAKKMKVEVMVWCQFEVDSEEEAIKLFRKAIRKDNLSYNTTVLEVFTSP